MLSLGWCRGIRRRCGDGGGGCSDIRLCFVPKIRWELPFFASPRPITVDRFLTFQLGLVQPPVVRAARTVFEEPALVVDFTVPFPRVIPCASKVEIISAELVMEYSEGITGNHFIEGGIDLIKIPLQVLSDIAWVLKLSTVTFRVRRSFM